MNKYSKHRQEILTFAILRCRSKTCSNQSPDLPSDLISKG